MGVSLIAAISLLWKAYAVLVLVRCLLSWTHRAPEGSGLGRFVHRATEPALAPLRRLVPPSSTGGWDLSPVVLVVVGGMLVGLLLKAVSPGLGTFRPGF